MDTYFNWITLREWGKKLIPPIKNKARLIILVKRLQQKNLAFKLENRIWLVCSEAPDIRKKIGRPKMNFLNKRVAEYIPKKKEI